MWGFSGCEGTGWFSCFLKHLHLPQGTQNPGSCTGRMRRECLLLSTKWPLCKRTLTVSLSPISMSTLPMLTAAPEKKAWTWILACQDFSPASVILCFCEGIFQITKRIERKVYPICFALLKLRNSFLLSWQIFLVSSLCPINSCSENVEFPSYTGTSGILGTKQTSPALHHSMRLLRYHCLHQITACYCWLCHRNNFWSMSRLESNQL